jgi:hypothetical protein
VLDTSDPLLAGQPRESRAEIAEVLRTLGRNDRVVVTEMAGDAPAEASPLVDACLPGSETNVERNAFEARIGAPIEARLTSLALRAPANASPLVETVLSLASDRAFSGPTSRLTVLMETDGLQNTALASAYRRGSRFPPPAHSPLRGVTVILFILHNPRDAALQPRGVAALAAWLKAAGAEVTYDQPPWMSILRHAAA